MLTVQAPLGARHATTVDIRFIPVLDAVETTRRIARIRVWVTDFAHAIVCDGAFQSVTTR